MESVQQTPIKQVIKPYSPEFTKFQDEVGMPIFDAEEIDGKKVAACYSGAEETPVKFVPGLTTPPTTGKGDVIKVRRRFIPGKQEDD